MRTEVERQVAEVVWTKKHVGDTCGAPSRIVSDFRAGSRESREPLHVGQLLLRGCIDALTFILVHIHVEQSIVGLLVRAKCCSRCRLLMPSSGSAWTWTDDDWITWAQDFFKRHRQEGGPVACSEPKCCGAGLFRVEGKQPFCRTCWMKYFEELGAPVARASAKSSASRVPAKQHAPGLSAVDEDATAGAEACQQGHNAGQGAMGDPSTR